MKIGQDERDYFAYKHDHHLTDIISWIEYWQSKSSQERHEASARLAEYVFRDEPERLVTFDLTIVRMGRFTPNGEEYF